jgi:hypothetical protein
MVLAGENRSTGRETFQNATSYTTNPMYCDAVYHVNFLISVLIFFKILAAVRCNSRKETSMLRAKYRRFCCYYELQEGKGLQRLQ